MSPEPTWGWLLSETGRIFAVRGRLLIADLLIDVAWAAHIIGANGVAARLIGRAVAVAPEEVKRLRRARWVAPSR